MGGGGGCCVGNFCCIGNCCVGNRVKEFIRGLFGKSSGSSSGGELEKVEDATKQTELETKRADVAEKQIQDMILRLSSTMDVKAMAILLNMSVDEIKKYI